jgi:N-acetylmuramoyl-L-alanine amidase
VTVYLPRSAWTSTTRGGVTLTGGRLLGLACHWPGSTQDTIGDPGQEAIAARLRAYRDYHINVRGWSDIGYNDAIDQAGRVWDCRGIDRVGAHAASSANPDANHEWVGVLFLVGDREQLTAQAIRAFQDFRFDVFLRRWPGRTQLTGHGRAPGVPGAQTDCPGPYVAARLTDGTLARKPSTEDDDMTPKQAQQLADVHRVLLAEDHFNDLMAAAARIDTAAGRIDDIEAKIDQLLTLHPPAPPTP